MSLRDLEIRRVRPVLDLYRFFQQAKQALDVRQRLADLAVDETEEIQRHEQLDHVGVDHHQIAQRHLARGHAAGGQQHHHGNRGGDDQRLTGVQQHQRQDVLGARLLPGGQALVVAPGLETLVAEVLHRFVVQQGIDRPGVGLVVALIGLAHEAGAPLGNPHRPDDVGRHRDDHRQGEYRAHRHQQDDRDHRDLDDRRQDVEHHEAQQEADAAGAALDVPGQAAGLARQMEAQFEPMQMFEHAQGRAPHGPLGHPYEDRVAQLAEQGAAKAQQAVGDHQCHRDRDQRLGAAVLEVVDDVFQCQRDQHGRQLGQAHQPEGEEQPSAELREIGKQGANDAPVDRVVGRIVHAGVTAHEGIRGWVGCLL